MSYADSSLSIGARFADAAAQAAAGDEKARTFIRNVESTLSPEQARDVLKALIAPRETTTQAKPPEPTGPRIITMDQSREEMGRGSREERIKFADDVIGGRVRIVDNP